jgi:hypothetical protein
MGLKKNKEKCSRFVLTRLVTAMRTLPMKERKI